MVTNFQPKSCTKDVCLPAVSAMLDHCVGRKIPDIPKGNPLAGNPFAKKRGEMIRQGMMQAGCNMPAIMQESSSPTAKPSESCKTYFKLCSSLLSYLPLFPP
jgi:hypothetical protein